MRTVHDAIEPLLKKLVRAFKCCNALLLSHVPKAHAALICDSNDNALDREV